MTETTIEVTREVDSWEEIDRADYDGLMHFTCADGAIELLQEIPGVFLRVGDTATARAPNVQTLFLWRCIRIVSGGVAEWTPETEWTEEALRIRVRVALVEDAQSLELLPEHETRRSYDHGDPNRPARL